MFTKLMLATALITSAITQAATPATVVNAPAGTLEGQVEGGTRIFLGIPYVQPPIGDLRWRAPEPLAKWRGIRPAK